MLEICLQNSGQIPQFPINQKEINLVGSPIGEKEALSISKLFQQASHIETLYLRRNHISDIAAHILAQALLEHTRLKKICIGDNQISTKGVSSLCEMLENNHYVSHLNITCTNFSDQDAEALARVIAKSSSLQQLLIQNSNFSQQGAECIAKALRWNSSIIWFQFYNHTRIASPTLIKIRRQVQENIMHSSKKKMRIRALLLLLCERKHNLHSVFSDDTLPLDLFKAIANLSELLI